MTQRSTSADFVTAFATGWPENQPDIMVLSLTTNKGVQDCACSLLKAKSCTPLLVVSESTMMSGWFSGQPVANAVTKSADVFRFSMMMSYAAGMKAVTSIS